MMQKGGQKGGAGQPQPGRPGQAEKPYGRGAGEVTTVKQQVNDKGPTRLAAPPEAQGGSKLLAASFRSGPLGKSGWKRKFACG